MSQLTKVNWNGQVIPNGDTTQWDAAAHSCFQSPQPPASSVAFNQTTTPPPPLTVTGGSAPTGTPSDSNRKVVGLVPGTGVVFGN